MRIRFYRARSACRGLTLLETLFYAAIWTVLALATMRVVGDSRTLRAKARDRATMVLIAQNELERARFSPAADLKAGKTERVDPDWPRGIKATVEMSERGDGTWLVDVIVTRQSVEGKPQVRLATVRPGGGP